MTMSTRAHLSAANAVRRRLQSLPSSSRRPPLMCYLDGIGSSSVDSISTPSPMSSSMHAKQITRSFATKKNKEGNNNKKQDAYKQHIKAQQSIIGKRPGQTSFSPPTNKTKPSTSPPKQTPLQSSPKEPLIQSNSNSNASINAQQMPLIRPPTVGQTTAEQLMSEQRDNKDHAHTYPSISSFTREEMEKEDNALRSLLLQQGVLPPPARPVVGKAGKGIGQSEASPIDIPEADPSGVSHANPEDVLDMASMYNPSIHLPDKPDFSTPANRVKYEAGTPLTDELIAYIGVRGPITVAEFMRRVLRDGEHGYYTSKGSRSGKKTVGGAASVDEKDDIDDDNDWDLDDEDDLGHTDNDTSATQQHVGGEHVIGSGGDFITAPEVSQLFGESLLVWLMTQYQTLHSPSQIQIIEIGPGKGTLICDILRSAVATFPDFASALTNGNVEGEQGEDKGMKKKVAVGVHLVEVANGMRARQKESLQNLEKEKSIMEKGYSFQFADDSADEEVKSEQSSVEDSAAQSSVEKDRQNNIHISWHDVLSSVPTHDAAGKPIPTFIICQELVDALPIHSFQKTDDGWRERLVDVAVRDDSEASEAKNDVALAVARKYASAESNDDIMSSSKPLSSTADSTNTQSSSPEASKKLPRLRFVLPPDTTPALRSMLRVTNRGIPSDDNPSAAALNSLPVGSIIEACPEGLVLVQDIADRIETCHGGAALIIDYGGDGSSGGDTLRGFWRHTQVHPLSRPGEVDVTADVDFGALREAVNQRVSIEESLERKRRKGSRKQSNGSMTSDTSSAVDNVTNEVTETESEHNKSKLLQPEAFGPISQGKFLAQMGIVQRVEKKIEDPETTDEEAYEIYSAMERLMIPEQMGERYKVLAIASKKEGLFPPPGF